MIYTKYKKSTGSVKYQIAYATKKDFSNQVKAKVWAEYSSGGIKFKAAKGKTYYVRVRACKMVSGKEYYGSWSDYKKVTVK